MCFSSIAIDLCITSQNTNHSSGTSQSYFLTIADVGIHHRSSIIYILLDRYSSSSSSYISRPHKFQTLGKSITERQNIKEEIQENTLSKQIRLAQGSINHTTEYIHCNKMAIVRNYNAVIIAFAYMAAIPFNYSNHVSTFASAFSMPMFTQQRAMQRTTPSKTDGVEIELPDFDELFGRIREVSPLAAMAIDGKDGGFAVADQMRKYRSVGTMYH